MYLGQYLLFDLSIQVALPVRELTSTFVDPRHIHESGDLVDGSVTESQIHIGHLLLNLIEVIISENDLFLHSTPFMQSCRNSTSPVGLYPLGPPFI